MILDLVKTWQLTDPAHSFFTQSSQKNAIILSGLSSPKQSSLSFEQLAIAKQLSASGYLIPQRHFPFNTQVGSDEPTQPKLLQACLANGHQYLLSLLSQEYAFQVARHLQPFFTVSEQALIITNSMGLQMLQVAQPHLEVPSTCSCLVLALGPVTSSQIELDFAQTIVVKGHQDWISHNFDHHPADLLISADHLNYFASDELQKILKHYGIISP